MNKENAPMGTAPPNPSNPTHTTHFGFTTVATAEKTARVKHVFDSVAPYYDLMNDVMSGGLHRLWKWAATTIAAVKPNERVLDIASGSGDFALALAKQVGGQGEVVMTDINATMLEVGKNRCIDHGYILPALVCDAQHIPFPDNQFDLVTIGFGLRNMTDKQSALAEAHRVLRLGGRLIVLEFSRPHPALQKVYYTYLNKILPVLGDWIAKDTASYQYLAESIQVHPDQNTLAAMLQNAGLDQVEYFNFAAGIVALHRGWKTNSA